MESQYFVMYRRDRNAETMKRAKGRMLYDGLKEFETREKATAFGLLNLQDTPIVAKKVESLSDYSLDAHYVVAAYFTNNYQSQALSESFPAPTHEVVTCNQENLDRVIEELANESPSKLYLGIEEKLVPTALDRIRSVNPK